MRIVSRMNDECLMMNVEVRYSSRRESLDQRRDERGKDVFKIKVVSDRSGDCAVYRGSSFTQTGRN